MELVPQVYFEPFHLPLIFKTYSSSRFFNFPIILGIEADKFWDVTLNLVTELPLQVTPFLPQQLLGLEADQETGSLKIPIICATQQQSGEAELQVGAEAAAALHAKIVSTSLIREVFIF